MWKVWNLLNLILPESCPICNKTPDNIKTSPLCRTCWERIELSQNKRRCFRCGLPIDTSYESLCLSCIHRPPYYDRMIVFGDYEGPLKEAIHYMKFHGRKSLARELGQLLSTLEIPSVEVITPVPLSKKRLIQRGFNQSYLLAKPVSKRLTLPLLDDLLLKTKDTPPQSLLTREERLKNQKGSFKVNSKYKKIPRRVVLVDDVVTTGATVNECARILKKEGVNEVYVITLARASTE